ncbi:MAG: hypothetical protein GX299_02495 [Epulopiscium sp.]|jgi:hypothetical protein|nr:hypothetical protein [Candidatus Epulonipiscium sp.]
MEFLEYIEEAQLPVNSYDSYHSMAFDGDYYYFLLPYQARTVKYNSNFEKIGSVPLRRKYSCMCYDFNYACFWAASAKYGNKIFKLDNKLNEMDCIVFEEYQTIDKVITSISCDPCSDSLFVSFSDQVLELDKITGQYKVLKQTSEEWITGIVSLGWGLMVVSFIEDKQYIYFMDENGEYSKQYGMDGYVIKGVLQSFYNEETGDICVSMLAAKAGGYSYILKTTISTPEDDNIPSQSVEEDAITPSCCNCCCCHCHPCMVDGGTWDKVPC